MNANKKIIMIVDDEPEINGLLKEFLKKEYIVFSVENGKEAWDILDSSHPLEIRPNLLITDLQMPEMDGVELVRRIRGQDQEIPIIAMTGGIAELEKKYGEEEIKVFFLHLIDTLFLKPFSLSFLGKRVKELLG